MGICNYCRYQRYKKKGYKIATSKERKKTWDKDIEKEFIERFGHGVVIVNKEGKFVSWFMELPKYCCC